MKNIVENIWIDLSDELYKFILVRIKDEQLAKDIHQEVFLKIHSNIHQLKHTSKLTSWVYQITRNTIIDYYRKINQKNILISEIDIPEVEDQSFDYSKLANCINQKIESLSSLHKQAILLTSFKGYSQKQLSDYLKISYSGTKSRIQKARDILKEKILDCPNVESDRSGKILGFEKK